VTGPSGSLVTTTDGSPHDAYTPETLASNDPLHPALPEQFRAQPERPAYLASTALRMMLDFPCLW
jgi:hypothetical protein